MTKWNIIFSRFMPCPSTGPKMFWTGPNILSQAKNWIAITANPKDFVLAQKPNLLNGNNLLFWHNKFGTGTICKSIFGLIQKFCTSPKHFGTCRRTRQKNASTEYFLTQCDKKTWSYVLITCSSMFRVINSKGGFSGRSSWQRWQKWHGGGHFI